MVFIVLLVIFLYIVIGSILGGLYYYLIYKNTTCNDLEDMVYLPVWITFFWPLIAPICFAIFYARKEADKK